MPPDPDPSHLLGYDLRPDGPGLRTRQRRELRAFAEAFFSRDAGPPDADRLEWLVDEVDDFVAHLGSRGRLLVVGCLLAVTHAGPAWIGRRGRLSQLPLDLRVQALESLEKSPAALALFALKTVASLCYYEHPDAAAEIGWDRRCRGSKP